MDGAVVEVDAAFDNHQAEACARDFADVGAAKEGIEEIGNVLFGNADALILDGEDSIVAVAFCGEEDWRAFGGVFDGVGDEVAEDVTEQGLVRMRIGEITGGLPDDGAFPIGG